MPNNVVTDVDRLEILIGERRAGNNFPDFISEAAAICQRLFTGGIMDMFIGHFTMKLLIITTATAKQLGMKAINVVCGKAIGTVGDVASKAFLAIKLRLARLIRGKPQPVKLPITKGMPARVSKIMNQAANERLKELAGEESRNITEYLIAGSGFARRLRCSIINRLLAHHFRQQGI